MPRDRAALMDILLAIDRTTEFLHGLVRQDFLNDERTQAAVVRQIEIIDEACNRLSRDFRSKHFTIPWRDIIAMRNILVHEYDEVDNYLVWKTAAEDLPVLKETMRALLQAEEDDAGHDPG